MVVDVFHRHPRLVLTILLLAFMLAAIILTMNKFTENIEIISVSLIVIVFVVILLLLGTLSVEQQNEFMDVFLYQQLVK